MRRSAALTDRRRQLAREYRSRGIHLLPASVLLFAPIPTRDKPPTIQGCISAALARRLGMLNQS
jgi:hypothetical protein